MSDGGDGIGQGHRGQGRTAPERTGSDGGDAGHTDGSYAGTVGVPWHRGIMAEVGHRTGTEDREHALGRVEFVICILSAFARVGYVPFAVDLIELVSCHVFGGGCDFGFTVETDESSFERIASDGLDGIGNGDRSESGTAVEGQVSNLFDGITEVQECEGSAFAECVESDSLDRIAEGDGGKGRTVGEGIISDGLDGTAEGHGSQGAAAVEGTLSDGRDIVGDVHGGQSGTAVERQVSDDC